MLAYLKTSCLDLTLRFDLSSLNRNPQVLLQKDPEASSTSPTVLRLHQGEFESSQQFYEDLVQLDHCNRLSKTHVFAMTKDEIVASFHLRKLLNRWFFTTS